MGSNTWRSDLAINETYRRSDSPAGRSGSTLGIPWMAGIPGTIGGWVKMNAGAFGHSIGEVISRVKVDGRWLSREECGFAYRHSDIDGEIQDVEWSVDLAGLEGDAGEYLARRKRFPAHTWGSFFKNPPGDAAGRLLEAAGAKSLKVGGAYVWSEHANVIVAGEGSTPSDVLALARLMHWRVMHRFGIALESEVRGIMI
jgi:UDP-N-acetylmuramate dehydrogenase